MSVRKKMASSLKERFSASVDVHVEENLTHGDNPSILVQQ